MKSLLYITLLFAISGCTKEMNPQNIKPTPPHSFAQVWNEVISDELDKLPQNKVTTKNLSKNARRTLDDNADILEPFDKVAHPNGICFKGIWHIDTQNIYSGLFKKDSKALIIARASTALSQTTSDTTRAFGFAGKLFNTTNPNQINISNTANFFLIDDLGGTDALHYRDVTLTNEPSTSFNMQVAKNLFYALKVARTFSDADKHSGIRQLYEISYLNEEKNATVITPKWMKIEFKQGNMSDAKDFRDELHILDDSKLIFNISVANEIKNDTKNFQTIGTITLDDSTISNSCDHRLHFHHPKHRDDLK